MKNMPSITADLMPVRPIPPAAGYVGGKRLLAKTLVPIINSAPHSLYAEPFVGMGGVFFRRDHRPKVEVINDKSGDVATFFRILQNHYQAFLDMLKWQLSSRDEFDRLLGQDPERLTDLQRAARFLYLQRLCYGGKITHRAFAISTTGGARFDINRLVPILEAVHERLSGVWIEGLPWQTFIERWDREGVLFYCDPPYYGVEDYYGKGLFDRAEFEALSHVLRGLKGGFILSLNDVPAVRKMFSWADIKSVPTSYSLAGMDKQQQVKELIIASPKLKIKVL